MGFFVVHFLYAEKRFDKIISGFGYVQKIHFILIFNYI